MKKIYKITDKNGSFIEVQLLNRNNEIPEDLIWLHCKKKKDKKWIDEWGVCIKPDEARIIIHGLFLAIDQIIEDYKLEKFKVPQSGRRGEKRIK